MVLYISLCRAPIKLNIFLHLYFLSILKDSEGGGGSWEMLTGYDAQQMNDTMLPTIVQHLPAPTSTFTVLQYAQEVNVKDFIGFDWGSAEANMQHHGQDTPPQYKLENVNTQIALYWGDNDWLAQSEDLLQIILKCQDVIYENYQVPWEGWNHLDFMYAIDVDKYINTPLIDMLNNFGN